MIQLYSDLPASSAVSAETNARETVSDEKSELIAPVSYTHLRAHETL